jgi:hypothetical protein
MTEWRSKTRTCACGQKFKPKREAQTYCSARFRDAEAKWRLRSIDKNMDKKPALTLIPGSMDRPVSGPNRASDWPLMPRL